MTELAPTPMPSMSPSLPHSNGNNKNFRRHSSQLYEDNLSTTSFSSPASSELQTTTVITTKSDTVRKISYGSNSGATNNLTHVHQQQHEVRPSVEKHQIDVDTIETAAGATTTVRKPRKTSFFGKVLRSLSTTSSSKATASNDVEEQQATKDDKKKAKKDKKSKKTQKHDEENIDDKIAAGSVISAVQSTLTAKKAPRPQHVVGFTGQDDIIEENDNDQHNLYYNHHQPRRININDTTAADKKRAYHLQQHGDGSKSTIQDDSMVESEKQKQNNLSSLAEVEEANNEISSSAEKTTLPSMMRKDVRHTPASLKIHAKLVDEFRARFQQQQQVANDHEVDDESNKNADNDEKPKIYVKPRGMKARPVVMMMPNNDRPQQHHRDDDSGINEKSPTNSSRSSSSVQVAASNVHNNVVAMHPKQQQKAEPENSAVSAFRFQPVFVAGKNANTAKEENGGLSAEPDLAENVLVAPAAVPVVVEEKSSKKKKSLASRLLSSIIRRGGDKDKTTKSKKVVAATADKAKEKEETAEENSNTNTLVRRASSSIVSAKAQHQSSYVAADISNEVPPIDDDESKEDEESLRNEKAVVVVAPRLPPVVPFRQSTTLSQHQQLSSEPKIQPLEITIEQLAHSPTIPTKNRNRTGSSSSGCVQSEDGTVSSSNNHADDEGEKVAPSASPSLSAFESTATSNNEPVTSAAAETKKNVTAASSSSGMSDGIATPEPTTLISSGDDSGFKSQQKQEQNRLMRKNNTTNTSASDDTGIQPSPSTLACDDDDDVEQQRDDDEVYEDDDDGVDLDGSTISNKKLDRQLVTGPLSSLLQRRGSMRKAREEADITITPLEQLQQQVNSSNIQRRNSKRASIRKKRTKKQPAGQKPSDSINNKSSLADNIATTADKTAKCMTLPPHSQMSLLPKPTPVRLYSSNSSQPQNYYNISSFTPHQSGCSPTVEHLIAAGLRTAAADANASRNWINSLRRPTPVLNGVGRQQSVTSSANNNPFSPNWQAPAQTAVSHLNFNHNQQHSQTIERPRSCVSGRLLMEHNSVVDQQRTLNSARARRRSERFKTVELSPTTLLAASAATSGIKPTIMAVEIA